MQFAEFRRKLRRRILELQALLLSRRQLSAHDYLVRRRGHRFLLRLLLFHYLQFILMFQILLYDANLPQLTHNMAIVKLFEFHLYLGFLAQLYRFFLLIQ